MGYGSKTNGADYRIGDPSKLRIPFLPTGKQDITIVDAINYLFDTIVSFGISISIAPKDATVYRVEDNRVTSDSVIEIFYSNTDVSATYTADAKTKIITITFEEPLATDTEIGIRVTNPIS